MNMNTKKNNLRDDERAVSPVVGVILMVAITVIMAAIIGAFVYGYGGSMTASATPAFMVSRTADTTITVTLVDMGGAGTVTDVVIKEPAVSSVFGAGEWTIGKTEAVQDPLLSTGTLVVLTATVYGEPRVIYNMMI